MAPALSGGHCVTYCTCLYQHRKVMLLQSPHADIQAIQSHLQFRSMSAYIYEGQKVILTRTQFYMSDWGRIYHLYIRPSPMYPSPKLIYCLYIVHKSVSEVLVPSTFQKYSIYISVPQKITLKKSLRQKGDNFFTEKGDFSSDSQKFVEILVNEKVIFQVICYKW